MARAKQPMRGPLAQRQSTRQFMQRLPGTRTTRLVSQRMLARRWPYPKAAKPGRWAPGRYRTQSPYLKHWRTPYLSA